MASPSLRGSGLKSKILGAYCEFGVVSLFTREWIEISILFSYFEIAASVSLFTREWIEITLRMI